MTTNYGEIQKYIKEKKVRGKQVKEGREEEKGANMTEVESER